MTPQSERIGALEQWAKDHDERCVERLTGIQQDIGGLERRLDSWSKAMWGLAIALFVWGAGELYAKLDHGGSPPAASAAARP